MNHNIDELLVGLFTQIKLREEERGDEGREGSNKKHKKV